MEKPNILSHLLFLPSATGWSGRARARVSLFFFLSFGQLWLLNLCEGVSSLSIVDPFMIRSEQLSRCACEHQRIKDELYRVLIGRVRQLGFLSRFSGVPSPHWVCVHSSSSSSCCSWTFPPSGCSQLTMWDGLWHFRALARREAAAALE